MFMIREWADKEGNENIDAALTSPYALADTWDDDEAWATFQRALND